MNFLKNTVKRALKASGLYNRVKGSFIYSWYWRFADPCVINGIEAEKAFYRKLLEGFERGGLIFDIGANHGRKTGIFLKLGAKVVAVDPDELNQQTLREKFLAYRLDKYPVTILGKAVSDRRGIETFWIDEPGSGKNTLNQKWVNTLKEDPERFGKAVTFGSQREVATTTLEDLINEYGRPFFIKIDVEGHEASVVRGLKHPVPFLSFEVNLPEFKQEGSQCIELLEHLCPQGKFNFTVDCKSGLELTQWLEPREFISVFEQCSHKCVEVIWKAVK